MMQHARMDCQHISPGQLNLKTLTYQANNDDDGRVAGQLIVGSAQVDELIARTGGSTPVHARDGAREHDGTRRSLPPGVCPGSAEDEEEGERDDTGGHGDDGGAHNVDSLVDDDVVFDRVVTDVVHAANGGSGQDATDGYAPPRNRVVGPDSDERGQEDDNRDEERKSREAAGVGDLQFRLPIAEVDGSVTDEVLPSMLTEAPSIQRSRAHTMHQIAIPPMDTAEPNKSRLVNG